MEGEGKKEKLVDGERLHSFNDSLYGHYLGKGCLNQFLKESHGFKEGENFSSLGVKSALFTIPRLQASTQNYIFLD